MPDTKMEVLKILRKTGKLTIVLSSHYYVHSIPFNGKLYRNDILIECPFFGCKDNELLKSLAWGFKAAVEEKVHLSNWRPMNVYVCDGWGTFTVIGKFSERNIRKAIE